MSNLQLIEALCGIVEAQAEVIYSLSKSIEETRALTNVERGMIDSVKEQYNEVLGADEFHDEEDELPEEMYDW